jgi:hypothetical protein
MLAWRLTTILPAMTLAEAIETTRTHGVAGRTSGHTAPPGEVSRAHHGMFVLDKLQEFRRHVLEVVRQQLQRRITERQFGAQRRPCGNGNNRGPRRPRGIRTSSAVHSTEPSLIYGCKSPPTWVSP